MLNLVLPFAWPADHRGWLPNRVPHVWLSNDRLLIPPTADEDELDTDPAEDELGELGIDVFPGRRIWLLRSPFPSVPIPALLDQIYAHAKTLENHHVLDAARAVFSLDEPE